MHKLSRRLPLLAVLLALLNGCFFNPYRALTEFGPESPSAEQCGECHVAIYEEFRDSPHASAWTDPIFSKATAEHHFQDCLGCHAPESVYVQGDPALRSSHPEQGVTCISCHFDGDVLAGPAPPSALVDPHPIAEHREIYLSSELCGKCHQGTYAEWQSAALEDKRTCQDCHMPETTRKLTQPTGFFSAMLVSFEEEFVGRRHNFHLAAVNDFVDALLVRVEAVRRDADSVHCNAVLINQLPHLIPTGDFGFRRILVNFQALDALGITGESQEVELFKELGQALAPLEPRRFELELPVGTLRLRVRLLASKQEGAARPVFSGEFDLP